MLELLYINDIYLLFLKNKYFLKEKIILVNIDIDIDIDDIKNKIKTINLFRF